MIYLEFEEHISKDGCPLLELERTVHVPHVVCYKPECRRVAANFGAAITRQRTLTNLSSQRPGERG